MERGKNSCYSHVNDRQSEILVFLNRIQLLVFTYEEVEVRKLWNHEQFEIAEKVIQKKVADGLLKDAEETSDTTVAIIAPEELQTIIEKRVQLILMSDYIEFETTYR